MKYPRNSISLDMSFCGIGLGVNLGAGGGGGFCWEPGRKKGFGETDASNERTIHPFKNIINWQTKSFI
jgi:hypothetical protein